MIYIRRASKRSIIGSLTVLICLLFFCLYCFSGSSLVEIQPIHDDHLVMTAVTQSNCCLNSNNGVWYITKTGLLQNRSTQDVCTKSAFVSQMIPIGNDVAYTTISGKLYYSHGNESTMVAKGISTFGYYGSQLVYATVDGEIYAWQENESVLLITVEDDTIYGLMGNEDYLFIYGENLTIYHREYGLQSVDLYFSSSHAYFLYENKFVLIGNGKCGGIVYDPVAKTWTELNLGFSTNSHLNKISVVSDGRWIYLSLHSKLWRAFGNETNSNTYCIDPLDWSVEVLNGKFYPNLICGKEGLYKFDTFKGRGKLICRTANGLREPS